MTNATSPTIARCKSSEHRRRHSSPGSVHTGMARVQALVMAEDARTKQIAAAAGAVIDGEFEEVTVDAAE